MRKEKRRDESRRTHPGRCERYEKKQKQPTGTEQDDPVRKWNCDTFTCSHDAGLPAPVGTGGSTGTRRRAGNVRKESRTLKQNTDSRGAELTLNVGGGLFCCLFLMKRKILTCKHRLTDDYILLKLQKRVVGIIIKVPCCVTTNKLFIESNILKFTAIMYLEKNIWNTILSKEYKSSSVLVFFFVFFNCEKINICLEGLNYVRWEKQASFCHFQSLQSLQEKGRMVWNCVCVRKSSPLPAFIQSCCQ